MSISLVRRISPAFALLGALALAGCGGGGESASSPSPSAPSPSVTASPSESTSTATPAAATTVDVASASYSKTFSVTACTPTQGGKTGVVLEGAAADGATVRIDAPSGTGTLMIAGGSEQDSVDLTGAVTKATVSDAAVSVSGTFEGGEKFTATGYCA